jgi:asparagine synthase (glutamine-hydrolysing)
MCGIVGIWNLDGHPVDLAALRRATTVIRHRGPDDEGYLLVNARKDGVVSCGGPDTDPDLHFPPVEQFQQRPFDLAFGFRRLSIQDLSPAGHQPMSSLDGRLWIIFNGEIYNYIELRAELSDLGHRFHTGTDTEVVLAAYRQWGEACLERFNGMWAFAIWDASSKSLFAARDRFGEKPFHYVYVPGKVFAFASEMKSLWTFGVVGREVHQETLGVYQCFGDLDAGEQTFYENILRLPQAHSLTLSCNGILHKRRYWDIDPRVHIDDKSDDWYSEKFREIFSDSVRIRLRSDVPVGSSLSGGIDSSTVVSVINRLLPADAVQKTFSARFDDPYSDEGKWIEKVINANRVEAHTVWPTGERMFEELEQLFWHQEEPFTSSSIYAQWCVMRLAKEHNVTVLLDGQGADEALGGYHCYFDDIADDLLKNLKIFGYWKLNRDCQTLHGRSPGSVKRVLRRAMPTTLKKPVKRVLKAAKNVPQVEPVYPVYPREFKNVSGLRKILWWNTTRHGINQLLRYADRNSMAHSREVRLPFLDHQLVEFVFKLPERQLFRAGWTKWILREAFQGIVPAEITSRVDKLAYMPPQQRWIGDLAWQDIMLSHLTKLTGSTAEEFAERALGASVEFSSSR